MTNSQLDSVVAQAEIERAQIVKAFFARVFARKSADYAHA